MKNRPTLTGIPAWLCFASLALAQEKAVAPAEISGVKGVKQDAVTEIKNVKPGIKDPTAQDQAAAPVDPVAPVAIPDVKGVKGVKEEVVTEIKNVKPGIKNATQNVQTVNKIDGIKAEAHAGAGPVKPVVQPVISGAGSIQAVSGVTGINAAKLQNLEAALLIKEDTGPHDGKAKAAAAALGGPPGKTGPKKKDDGRDGFQEFEKLKANGS